MHFATSLCAFSVFLGMACSTPLRQHNARQSTSDLTNFLLVTTTSEQPPPNGNSSLLPDVNATVLFDPYHQYTFLLRTTGAGYGSLPTFNLTNGTLHTEAYQLLTGSDQEYNSTTVTSTEELGFDPTPETAGNLALKDGYLLTVDGECEGWTVCTAEIEQPVIYWKGNDTSCVPVFVQAVTNAPY